MKDLKIFQQFAPQLEEKFQQGNNAVIYTRVSSADQEDNTSLASQKKYCDNFAEKKGLNVVGYFGGTYESAKTDDRKEFGKLLNFVKRSKNINYIIVYSYERFSRSGMNGAQIADDLLKKYGVITLAVTQELDPTTPAGSFQQKILFLFGQMDNELRRDKVVTGMKELLLNGFWVWGAPKGYKVLNKGLKASERQIVITEEGKKLRKAFEWKANLNLSNVEISRRLKKMGVHIPDKRLNELFKNPFYCGLITSKMIPGQVVEGKHEALVSKKLFLAVHDIRQEKRIHGFVHNQDFENLPLKVFTKCAKCERSLSGYLVKKKGLYYYKCSTKGCKVNRSAKAMHKLFKEVLSVLHIEKEELEVVKIQLEEQFHNFFESHISEQKALKVNLTNIKKKIDKIEERFVLEEIDRDMYTKFKTKFSKEYVEIEKELGKTSINSSNLKKAIDFAVELCSNPLKMWEKANYHTKQAFQNLIFPDGISYNRELDQYRTTRINSFFALIPELTRGLRGNKKGEMTNVNQFPCLVGPEGLEPSTP
ncbi:MAG: recombinase family protein [Flavobacteriales bacterium]|nr:recombinase family protein [Flavobacteriales bacterium]